MMKKCLIVSLLLISWIAPAAAEEAPLALIAEAQGLGRGAEGTVVGVVFQIAPEDRDRLGDRVRVVVTLISGEDVVDRHTAVVELEEDGSAILYREWKAGEYELRVGVADFDGSSSGLWIGDIEVPEMEEPFTAPEDATPDAAALELTPPDEGGVRFLPPPDTGGIGALQLQVEAPENTRSVEFFQDSESMGRRNRPPWTISVPLGAIVRRTTIRAVAVDNKGRYLGEDAVVLNSPTGQIGVEVLMAPESSITDGKRKITVSLTSDREVERISLSLDDRTVARWAKCPCVTEVSVAELDRATILTAEAVGEDGVRGDVVLTLGGGSGFVGSVRVELVELPVVVLNKQKTPVLGLTQQDFTVFEDDKEVVLEGFGTTADLPLSLAMAVDTSGSMVEEWPDVRRAVSGFTDALIEEDDEVVLITFSWDAKLEVEWTDQVARLGTKLERVQPDGGTSLHDAVVRSLEEFRGRRGRQALVLLTDGEDTTSRTGWKVAERFAHTMRIPIFPIGLGLGKLSFGSKGVLKALAGETGGESFYPKDVSQLPAVYDRIAELLRSQYLLWYRSPSDKPLEEFREIRVEVGGKELMVETIRGYYPGK
jgi:Ca-activated chloride channel family protein